MSPDTPASPEQMPASLTRRVLRGAAYLGLGQYGVLAIGLIKTPILSRLISPELFGIVALAVSWTSFLQVFRLELREIVISDPHGNAARLNTQFFIELTSSLPGILIALLLYLVWPDLTSSADWVAIFTLLAARILTAVWSTPLYILHRDIRHKTISQLTLLGAILGFVASVTLAWTGHPLPALLADATIPMIVLGFGAWVAAGWMPTLALDREVARDVFGFAFTLWTGGLLGKITFELDDWLVGRLRGAQPLGYYSRAYTIAKMPMDVFGGVIGGIALSMYAQALAEGQHVLSRAYNAATWLLARIVAWSSVVILAAGEEFTAVLLGPQWERVPFLLRLMFLFVLGRPLFQNNAQLLTASRHEKRVRRTLVFQAVILLVLGPPAVYFFGAEGASVAVSVMMLSGLVASHVYVVRIVDVPFFQLYGLPTLVTILLTPLIFGLGQLFDAKAFLMLAAKGLLTTVIFGGLILLFERRRLVEIRDQVMAGILSREKDHE